MFAGAAASGKLPIRAREISAAPNVRVARRKRERITRRYREQPSLIGLAHACDLLKGFAAESFGDLDQSGSHRIGQPVSGGQMRSKDAILGRQVFVTQQQFLIDETCRK